MVFPKDYPNNPPSVRFVSEMWHPNVYDDGKVCISILHSPGDDPLGYEQANERWSPVQTVETIMLSIISMLSSPNDESRPTSTLPSSSGRTCRGFGRRFRSACARARRCDGGAMAVEKALARREIGGRNEGTITRR